MTESSNSAHEDDPQRRIEAIAEEFLAGLQAGEWPDPADVLAAHPDLAEPLKRRLALVERLFRAGQNAKARDGGPMPAERAHRLKCPHCGNRIQLVEPSPKEITCVNCGSSFRVEPGTTATYRDTGPGGTIGRFAVLELLGRGAFGEVYKARDPQLDRFVALKVPRADYFATSEEEQRFLREARSAAGLRHPSIVQVYEIAHERGSPYIVSDYIDGLTLADLISGGRPAFRESAELVAQLADALDYAHRQKIVHRDIKPSNILLATGGGGTGGVVSGGAGAGAALDTHYAPFLADFGLARRDEGEITVTHDGQVLGTPAYMSPEQAAGDHARVDGRSDVYSLGVVLYELLSGELPFRGSRRMLLHQVLNDEPRPPRTLNDQIPRDLETICLKAMAKEPARRYLTAADFRDDLRRFLRGDPVAARRVGRPERAWRWCIRNPAMSGLAASLAVALVGGTLVASYLAVAEHDARIDEEVAKGKAITAREQSDRVAARSLIAPLDPEAAGGNILSRPEREALWELATLEDDTLWLRSIDDGTRDPKLAAALCVRSQPAMIAAVGLNLDRRERAEALLLDRVRDTSLPVRQRAEAAFVALELVEEPGPLADACVIAIRGALAEGERAISSMAFPWRAKHFWRTKSHLEPRALAASITVALRAGPGASFDNIQAADDFQYVLTPISDRLDPADAKRVLNEAMRGATGPIALWSYGGGLAHVAARMQPPDAAPVRREAANAMNKALETYPSLSNLRQYDRDEDSPSLSLGAWELVDLAMHMEPGEGTAVLMQALNSTNSTLPDTSGPGAHCVLARGLVTVATRMEGAEASRACAEAARILLGDMRATDRTLIELSRTLHVVVETLPFVVEGMDQLDRVHVLGEAVAIITNTEKRDPLRLAFLLAGIAEQMEPNDAASVCVDVADELTEALRVETDLKRLAGPAKVCASIAQRLGQADARRVRSEATRKLIEVLRETEWDRGRGIELREIVEAVSQVAQGMEPSEAERVCGDAARILAALHQGVPYEDEENSIFTVAAVSTDGLAKLAPRMQPDEASQLLIEALHDELIAERRRDLAFGLAAVAARMDSAPRAQVCAEVSEALINAMRAAQDEQDELSELAEGLASVAAQMSPEDAAPVLAEAGSALLDQMRVTSEEQHLHTLTESLLTVATKMERTQRAHICADMAHVTLHAMEKGGWVEIKRPSWLETLALPAEQVGPRDTANLVATAMRIQLSRLTASLRGADEWSNFQFDEDAFIQSLAFCDSRAASNAARLFAQIACAEGDPWITRHYYPWMDRQYAPIGSGGRFTPYVRSASHFNDLLSETAPTAAVEGANKPPQGCRLTTPELVELLKMPTCFGAVRRVILDHLENRYGQRFNTVWAFVRFAEAEKLGLDFTTPPRRPDPAKMEIPSP